MSIYVHAEAFCLMRYASDDGMTVEWIWNSRDGVTPFVVVARDGKTELQHIEWRHDVVIPDYAPQPGERIFVDLTPERAMDFARRRIEQSSDDPSMLGYVPPERKDEAIEKLARSVCTPGAPDLVLVADLPQPLRTPAATPKGSDA